MITIGDYVIDAALSEDHTFDSEVTTHPVERGSNITDHIRKLPISVTIEGIVSDTPVGRAGVVRSGVAALQEEGLIETQTFSSEALDALLAVRDRAEPVTITTSLKVYSNMALERLSVPKDAATGAALRFTATFVEIRIVENKRTRVRTAVPRGRGKGRGGNKPSKPTTPTPSTTMYACVRHRTVFVRHEDLARVRAIQSSTSGAVWTDWKSQPDRDHLQPILICIAKKPINRNSDGVLTTADVQGNQRPLLPNEIAAAELDVRDRADIANLSDPIDARTGRPLSWTDRAMKQKATDALTKPAWQRKVEELAPMEDSSPSPALERMSIEQQVRQAQGWGR